MGVLGGSKIDLAYSVGGGGGHSLHIRGAKAILRVRSSAAFGVPDVNSRVRNDVPQLWRSFPAKAFGRGKLVGQWKDQGWGNQKGHIYARKDGGKWIRLTSKPAPHRQQQFSIPLPPSVFGGSKIGLAYSVGGGGGHSLHIRGAKVIFGFKGVATPNA